PVKRTVAFRDWAGYDVAMHPDTVAELVRHCQARDPAAERELFALYAQRLTRLAETLLDRRLAGRADGEDVALSVFRTFFRHNQAGEYQIDTSSRFWSLVAAITRNKVCDRWREHTREKRDVRAEEPKDVAFFEKLAGEPDPADAVAFLDLIEAVKRGLPPFD